MEYLVGTFVHHCLEHLEIRRHTSLHKLDLRPTCPKREIKRNDFTLAIHCMGLFFSLMLPVSQDPNQYHLAK